MRHTWKIVSRAWVWRSLRLDWFIGSLNFNVLTSHCQNTWYLSLLTCPVVWEKAIKEITVFRRNQSLKEHARRIPADENLRDQLTEDLITTTNDEHDWNGIFNCAGCPVWRRGIFERPRYVPFFLSSLKLECRLFQLNLNSSAPGIFFNEVSLWCQNVQYTKKSEFTSN